MPYIDVVQPENAEGTLKDIYDGLLESRGKIAEVHKIQSLNPESIRAHMDLYMTIMYGKSPLKRLTRELIGTVVSQANKCEYCVNHHAQAVQHYWKDEDRLRKLISDYRSVDLDDAEKVLCDYAWTITIDPSKTEDGSEVEKLKSARLTDRQILDATLVCGYFNFVNRIVLSLGVQLEQDGGTGYKFDAE